MVFNGKPSKACLRCRQRKLRCDLHQKACGQCLRAGAQCSGYRNPDDLRVLDQSKKAQQLVLARLRSRTSKTLDTPITERARNVFYTYYVSGFSSTYDYLDQICAQPSVDDHLTLSIDAISLAFFSVQFHSTDAATRARERYVASLPLLNAALASPSMAKTDSTLLCILLLDLFEKITNTNPRSSELWMSHVRGALALVRLRKDTQFRSLIGLQISLRLFTNMLISCVAAESPVPLELLELRMSLERHLKLSDPKWRVSGLCIKYADLRANMKFGLIDTDDSLVQAEALDREFLELLDSIPSNWKHKTLAVTTANPRVLELYFDVYPSCHSTQTWNVLRIVRIVLNDMIRSVKKRQLDDALVHHCTESGTIDSLARQICASGPQFTTFTKVTWPQEVERAVQLLHCYTLLFPFYVAAKFASPSSGIKSWVVEQLEYLATEMGIRNAGVVMRIINSGSGLTPWEVYAILGSYALIA